MICPKCNNQMKDLFNFQYCDCDKNPIPKIENIGAMFSYIFKSTTQINFITQSTGFYKGGRTIFNNIHLWKPNEPFYILVNGKRLDLGSEYTIDMDTDDLIINQILSNKDEIVYCPTSQFPLQPMKNDCTLHIMRY